MRTAPSTVWIGSALIAAMATAAFGMTATPRAVAHFHPKGGATLLHVPHGGGEISLDGDMDDPGWLRGCARTHSFRAEDGQAATPYSDARLVWQGGFLYVALYAADIDIRALNSTSDSGTKEDDSFHLVFETANAEYSFDVNPRGALRDARRRKTPGVAGDFDVSWNSGAHVSAELDGTVNRPGDYDEEWGIEMAIPLDSLELEGEQDERIGFFAGRCDTLPNGARSCGTWGGGERRGVLVFDAARTGQAVEVSSL